ncbi:class I SAM-dependent methyltransferase [Marinobacter sp.]|uniref:class I SAM-dependent methyltransferase n=1 Tax=Marinobacter sp. TaxID=50741 RepID=UPI002B26EF16|nr:class I SAM-dependent methyltransferase [Marinobacter sp.]
MPYKNPIFQILCKLGVCNPGSVEQIQPFVRDRRDLSVMQCKKSEVIFLSRTDHIDISHYDKKEPTHQHGTQKREIITTNDDSERRFQSFSNTIRGKKWLDFGSGSGAILDRLGPLSADYAAVEPQETAAGFLSQLGHKVYRRIDHVPDSSFDVITLFHVFEHLNSPLDTLSELKKKLTPSGKLIVEVPHARDFLINKANCSAFKEHTFWSEHLILHTRSSLSAMLQAADLKVEAISGIQRYPLANTLHWLAKGVGSGHTAWSYLCDNQLDSSWQNMLAKLDLTDTIVAEASIRLDLQ